MSTLARIDTRIGKTGEEQTDPNGYCLLTAPPSYNSGLKIDLSFRGFLEIGARSGPQIEKGILPVSRFLRKMVGCDEPGPGCSTRSVPVLLPTPGWVNAYILVKQ